MKIRIEPHYHDSIYCVVEYKVAWWSSWVRLRNPFVDLDNKWRCDKNHPLLLSFSEATKLVDSFKSINDISAWEAKQAQRWESAQAEIEKRDAAKRNRVLVVDR